MIIVWFRKDLRLEDNPAFCQALEQAAIEGRGDNQIHAVYLASKDQWQQHNGSGFQADFIERHLNLLGTQLAGYGIRLSVLSAPCFADSHQALSDFCQQHKGHINNAVIFANQELEYNEQQRDLKLSAAGVALKLYEADVIIAKGTVRNKQDRMFKVFTPFKHRWLNTLRQQDWRPLRPKAPNFSLALHQRDTISLPYSKKDSCHWPLANQFIENDLAPFLTQNIEQYSSLRDIPGVKGTSQLSPYLAIGAISVKTIITRLLEHYPNLLDRPEHPAFSWLNELIWREFYRHLMFAFPKLSRQCNFRPQYNKLLWVNDQQVYQAWCEGKTGYPLVDAAMRQLVTTGWMHNRLRMIVASFLTKHLLVDWRLGERFFSQHLIDNDLAANNGGWQWAAGTGCDAQPYFRIFNPISQSKKFDPQGRFIRQYLPQLAELNDQQVHFPDQGSTDQYHYWPAIVDHPQARAQALAFYSDVNQQQTSLLDESKVKS